MKVSLGGREAKVIDRDAFSRSPAMKGLGEETVGKTVVCPAVQFAGDVWACGLQWSLGDIAAGRGLNEARARVAEIRKKRQEGKVLSSLVVVRQVGVKGEGRGIREQYGLARAGAVVEPGVYSLADHLAERWREGRWIAAFRFESAVYVLVVENGVIRSGSDVCYARAAEGLRSFGDYVSTLGMSEGWRCVAGEGIELGGRLDAHVKRIAFEELVLGEQAKGRLRALSPGVSRTMKRNAIAAGFVSFLALGAWWALQSGIVNWGKSREVAQAVMPAPWSDTVAVAEWEHPGARPSAWVARCVRSMRAVPVYGSSGHEGALVAAAAGVGQMVCSRSGVEVYREPVLVRGDLVGRAGFSEGFDLVGEVEDESWAARPVALDGLPSGLGVSTQEARNVVVREARLALEPHAGAFGRFVAQRLGWEMDVGGMRLGVLETDRELAWATLEFNLRLQRHMTLARAERVLREVDDMGTVVLNRILWTPGVGWEVGGVIGGATQRLEAVRGAQRELELAEGG